MQHTRKNKKVDNTLKTRGKMKKNKIIGLLLLLLAIYTIVGMVINDNTFWLVYNYVTIILSVISGILLLKKG